MNEEEKVLLSRLAAGELDGPVGDIREYGVHKTVYCGKYINGGIPISFREGASERFFNGKENERIPGKRIEERYETDDEKLEFLQRYGFLMDDAAVREYSARFKPTGRRGGNP